jgi:hypothetical protein
MFLLSFIVRRTGDDAAISPDRLGIHGGKCGAGSVGRRRGRTGADAES